MPVSSERKPRCKLQNSRQGRGRTNNGVRPGRHNLTEILRCNVRDRVGELRMVEQIEGVNPDFQFQMLRDRGCFGSGQIQVSAAWAPKQTACSSSIGQQGGVCKNLGSRREYGCTRRAGGWIIRVAALCRRKSRRVEKEITWLAA